MAKKFTSLTELQETLIGRLLTGKTRYQGFYVNAYEKQAAKLGYDYNMVRVHVGQCYEIADLRRYAR